MRKTTGLAFFLTVMLSSALWISLNAPSEANPIPTPTLLMPREYINITVSLSGETVLSRVTGVYPFGNLGYDRVIMYYPLPPDSSSISARMNETSLEWAYSSQVYPNVLGDWPMINWTLLLPPTCQFDIGTYYEHAVPKREEYRALLYAMGTGRYLETYAKQTQAFVNIRMELGYSDPQVYTVSYWNGTSTWKPHDFKIVKEDGVDVITLNVTSSMFHPLTDDLVLLFAQGVPWDINKDGKVDLKDVFAVARAYGSHPGDPNWNPACDINQDLKVDLKDYYAVCRHFGKAYP
jgi:hypothetical protein